MSSGEDHLVPCGAFLSNARLSNPTIFAGAHTLKQIARPSLFIAAVLVVALGAGCGGSSSKKSPDAGCATRASAASLLSLDAGSAACLACVRRQCTTKIQACASDCVCNETTTTALICLERLTTSASTADVATCVSGLASSSNVALGQVGLCLATCEVECAAPAPDGGADAPSEVGAADAGTDAPADAAPDAPADVAPADTAADVAAEAPTPDAPVAHPDGGPPFYVYTSAMVARTARAGVLADFDEDGKLDLALAGTDTTGNSGAVIALGDGAGGFVYETTVGGVGTSLEAIVAGDFNGDKHQDIVVSGFGVGPFIALGKGDGTFKTATSLASATLGGGDGLVGAGDFNGDGHLDVAAGYTNGMFVLLGDGTGAFSTTPVRAAPMSVFSPFAVGDLNADTLLDIAYGDNTLWTAINNGPSDGGAGDAGSDDGGVTPVTFTGTNVPNSGSQTRAVALGDLDKNGRLDVIASYVPNNPAPLFVLLQRTNGTFMPLVSYGTDLDGPPVVADFDGDHDLDVVSTSGSSSAVVFFHGDGAGALGAPVHYQLAQAPAFALTADINKNGKPDIIAISDGVVVTALVQ
jgi:hypothetical protein